MSDDFVLNEIVSERSILYFVQIINVYVLCFHYLSFHFSHQLLDQMLTTTFFTVIDHNIVFQIVQSTLGFHVINTISPHPASEYNIILKRTRSGGFEFPGNNILCFSPFASGFIWCCNSHSFDWRFVLLLKVVDIGLSSTIANNPDGISKIKLNLECPVDFNDLPYPYPLTSPELYNIIYLKPTWLRRIFPRQLCRSKCSPPAWSVLTSWSCPICICRQISPITTHRHVRDIWRCCAILREGAFWHTPNF